MVLGTDIFRKFPLDAPGTRTLILTKTHSKGGGANRNGALIGRTALNRILRSVITVLEAILKAR